MKYSYPTLIFLIFICTACNSNRYAATNKIYTQRVNTATEAMGKPLPPPITPDRIRTDVEGLRSGELMITPLDKEKGKKKEEDWVGAVHFNLRKPNFVIIHHTAQDSAEQTVQTFILPHTQVSAHYVIGRDGKIYQMLNDFLRGWHAGVSKWGSVSDVNSASLGIELDNNGKEPFSEEQINSLLVLLDVLKRKHNIPTANFLAHGDISPGRKVDPSAFFPWEKLAKQGFGLWYDDELVTPPDSFNAEDALRIIGYDTKNLAVTIRAFKRKYAPHDSGEQLNPHDLRVLYNLYKKY